MSETFEIMVSGLDEAFDEILGEDKTIIPTLFMDQVQGKKTYFFDYQKYNNILCDLNTRNDIEKLIEKSNTDRYFSFNEIITNNEGTFCTAVEEIKNNKKKVSIIDNGFYSIGFSNEIGHFLTERDISMGDTYIDLNGDLHEFENTIDKFYTKKSVYIENGMKHKLGVLAYGAPGNGKSVRINQIIKKYQDQAVIIFVDSSFPNSFIKKLKNFDQPYIFIFEELTQNISDDRELAQILLFLDGENSLNQQLVFATTNYPEDLPANLASRPGRFDKLFHIDNPSDLVRRQYLEAKLGSISDEIIKLTKDQSIAYLREMIIASKINDTSLEDEIKNNKARIKLVKSAFKNAKSNLGFGCNQE